MRLIRGCMAEIHHKINETMHLGVRAEQDTLYIDKLDSTQSIRMTSYVGSRAPLYCTALGKAILSTMDDGEVRRLYADVPMTALLRIPSPAWTGCWSSWRRCEAGDMPWNAGKATKTYAA